MFDELRYRWALRKFLKEHRAMSRDYEQTPDDPDSENTNFEKHGKGKELNYQTAMLDGFRSDYLIEQAQRYHVPIPDKKEDWMQPRFASKPYLTPAAAQKLRADIRSRAKSRLGLLGEQSHASACFDWQHL